MLVLTRKKDEGILIGKDILITIIDTDKEKVRLGIEAPRDIRVIRQELIAEIGMENKIAAQSSYGPVKLNGKGIIRKT